MKIVISSQARLLNILRGAVTYRALRAGFTPSEAEHMTVAINEAAANVIRHAYKNSGKGTVSLEIVTHPDRMVFILEDSAPKVQPSAIRSRPLDEIRPGGLGTFFINSYMDECAFDEQCAEGNRLVMVKFFRGKVSTGDESTSSIQ